MFRSVLQRCSSSKKVSLPYAIRNAPSASVSFPLVRKPVALWQAQSFHGNLRSFAENHEQSSAGQSSQSQPPVRSMTQFVKLVMTLWGQHLLRYAIIAGVLLFFTAAVYSISSWFSSINFKDVAMWSFYIGILTGVCAAGITVAAYRWFSIHPNRVFKTALTRVATNAHVIQKLGTGITPGKFRCFAMEYSGYEDATKVPLSRKMQFWKPARLQMIFPITGSNGKTATVSCEVEKLRGLDGIAGKEFFFHSLAVDIHDEKLDDHTQQLLVDGKAEHVVFTGETRLR